MDLDWDLLESPSPSSAVMATAAAAAAAAAAGSPSLSSAVVTTTSTVMSAPSNKSHTFPRPAADAKKYAYDDLDSDGILSDPYSASSVAGPDDDKSGKDEDFVHPRRGSRRHRQQQQLQQQHEYVYDTEDTDR